MKKSTILHDRQTVVRRLIALGLRPVAACSFADQVLKWARSCGEEWCVARLKELKQQKIRLIAGLPLHPNLVKPKGAVRHVFTRPNGVALDCLNIYTMFVNQGAPTEKQLSKFLGSMRKSLVETEEYSRTISELDRFARSYGKSFRSIYRRGSRMELQFVDTFTTDHQTVQLLRTNGLESWGQSPGKRCPSEMFKYKTTPETEMSTLDHMFLVTQPGLSMYPWDLCVSEAYQLKANQGMFPLSEFSRRHRDVDFDDDSWFGCISFIQEGGYKLRAVANPVRPVQALLSKMGFGLYNVLKTIPNDFTHDHQAGVDLIQKMVKSGRTVYSVDLSDATNNLPLDPQLSLLQSLGCEQWEIDLFHHSSRGLWSLPASVGGTSRWTVGQPLGTFPSFASFALMHHMICELALMHVIRKHRYFVYKGRGSEPRWYRMWSFERKPVLTDVEKEMRSNSPFYSNWGSMSQGEGFKRIYDGSDGFVRCDNFPSHGTVLRPWAIIGDDLVIFDDEVYQEYRLIIDALQVPVSEEKTLISRKCAEFAKRVITADSVVLPYKWSPINDFAVKDYLTRVGPKGLSTLTQKQRRVAEKYTFLPQPFGLGWNPKGIPLIVRAPYEMLEWRAKGSAPFVPPRDDEPPMTNVLKKDISDFWFIGTGLKEAKASTCPSIPNRNTGLRRLYESMEKCGLPVLSNLADLLYEHLVHRSGRSFTFDDDSTFLPLLKLYEHKLAQLDRRGKPVTEMWPGSHAIDRLMRDHRKMVKQLMAR